MAKEKANKKDEKKPEKPAEKKADKPKPEKKLTRKQELSQQLAALQAERKNMRASGAYRAKSLDAEINAINVELVGL